MLSYNTSQFTLRDLGARASQQQLKADFEAYLDGFSPSVQDILENFEFRNQIPRLSKADALGTLIGKFLSPDINLSPNPVKNGDGSIKHLGLDNHDAMGTVFEELVRRFNEENNEEAGEHWTPRDAVAAPGVDGRIWQSYKQNLTPLAFCATKRLPRLLQPGVHGRRRAGRPACAGRLHAGPCPDQRRILTCRFTVRSLP
jgi:hypothetical protein